MKTAELVGQALNWAVAKCDNRSIRFDLGGSIEVRGRTEDGQELPEKWDLWMPWHPSTKWEQAGPIIEREGISIIQIERDYIENEAALSGYSCAKRWAALLGESTAACSTEYQQHDAMYQIYDDTDLARGNTPLIAAMRCFVAYKFGNNVDVPEALN